MKDHERFTWREIEFAYVSNRAAWIGSIRVAGRELWFFLQADERAPATYQAWVEWKHGHTVSCTMPKRNAALEGARLELIDVTRMYHEELLKRFG